MKSLAERIEALAVKLSGGWTVEPEQLSDILASVRELERDAGRLRAIAELKHVSINPWMVQAYRDNETVGSAYHAHPMTGTPRIHASKLDALRSAIDAAISKTKGST